MNKVEEYFQTKAISNSFLGTLYNPRWVKIKMDNPDMEDDDKKYFRIGSGLDCLLTDPDRWETDFIVVDAIRPYGFMGKFIDNLPSGLTQESPVELYQEAYDKAGYKMAIGKVIEKFWSSQDVQDYYSATRNIDKSKTVLSKDEYDSVIKAKELILANEYIVRYFYPQTYYDEIMKQVPIYFEYRGHKCKALLDGVWIDHKNKKIKPYDLKTIGKSVYDFHISYTQFGYYRQCAFYELALLSDASPIKEFLDDGYEMEDFRFIVVENKSSSSHPAIIYKTNKHDRKVGKDGGVIGKKYFDGIDDLITAYEYHTQINKWDLPKKLYESEGEIELNVFDNVSSAEELSFDNSDFGD